MNLLQALGADVGYLGEYVFSKAFPNAARGEHVAMLVEGVYSSHRLKPRPAGPPAESGPGIYSRHVNVEWPIHKSWFVPVVDYGEPAVLVDPPKRLVKYVGRDVDGAYAYILSLGLAELTWYIQREDPPSLLRGLEAFTEAELEAARLLYKRLGGDPEFVAQVVETLREVDFLLVEDGEIYHVEVKTTARPTDAKLRKKRAMLQRRQAVVGKLGLKPALAVVVPRENWEVELWLEKG
ncbi:hypothetical protein [Pyrobaculum neutrophilum]|uniref:Uncharacterized protein n=1 Tax=Pyrobaculum neutrophilum (strain DSM 2338 / JCM 9278 / NBRC 100436 / V24Sta) TaxID=444157 RepID=B1YA09_PYRNV|nr:hypothetical protein [Pyrobaculum neutrophilum]ACB40559.1 conserved hypothetical protein [Pyrobaculum neutrophilum V24Sta]